MKRKASLTKFENTLEKIIMNLRETITLVIFTNLIMRSLPHLQLLTFVLQREKKDFILIQ